MAVWLYVVHFRNSIKRQHRRVRILRGYSWI